MRGARRGPHLRVGSQRIIPAYAGSTLLHTDGVIGCWDHPRVCGEHLRAQQVEDLVVGSSPRMRGAQYSSRFTVWKTGIIPAYAGSTTICAYRQNRNQDHPRVCGEHYHLRLSSKS